MKKYSMLAQNPEPTTRGRFLIDPQVYRLYDLTPEEIKTVEDEE